MDWQLIQSQDALEQVLLRHARAQAVAVDTEFMRRDTFFPRVALLQLCFDERAYLVDPLALEDVEPLAALLCEPATVKVLHSASEDLEVFRHWLGVVPRPLFDTQRALGLLDRGFGLGYRAVVESFCGVTLDKGETRSDWLARPLSEAQCDYAALDVAYLLPIYRELRAQAESAGKLDWIFEEGESAAAQSDTQATDYALRMKSAWRLNARALAALRNLCDWRESEAVRRDKPRSWIVDDASCLAVAAAMPADAAALQRVEGVRAALLRRYGDDMLQAVRAAQALPEAALAEPLPAPLDNEERQQLKRLKARGKVLAAGLGVAPEALLPARDYEQLLREHRSGRAPAAAPSHWQGWRSARVIEPLRAFLGAGQGADAAPGGGG